MLRFFRHIRQRLFLEGKVSRYLGYAIGEILLIMIGIFLALQLNNWNEERKDRLEEKDILNRIKVELEGHKANHSNRARLLPRRKQAIDRVASVFEGEPVLDDLEFLNVLLDSAGQSISTPSLRSRAYDELLNSGKIGLIRNTELRDLITDYYSNNLSTQNRGNAVIGRYASIAFDLVPRKGEFTQLDDLSEETASKVVESVLQSELGSFIIPHRNRINFLSVRWALLKEDGLELLQQIETELNN